MGVRPEAACPGATATVQASYASPDAKQQRGTTIPSIQEFLEAISRVGACAPPFAEGLSSLQTLLLVTVCNVFSSHLQLLQFAFISAAEQAIEIGRAR